MGITYNAFHVTAVCSPTRAALLTGRNQHRVGFGSIAEYPGPFPGYTSAKPKSCAGLPRILKENGYVTGGFGKWHLTPNTVQGAAGPFDHWPKSWGFDHWWGFLSGAAGQYDPIITQDDAVLGVPEGKDGAQYYFPDDITDKAVEWLHGVRAQDAHKPWFMFYSTGCAHAPHHVPKEWADRYEGKFDDGWDELRKRTLERQKQLGIVPQDTELTERPDAFPAWDSLDDTAKKLYARQMEVYAGYQENADWNIGRLLDSIEEMGDLDNTLIIWIWGDNGASLEGTTTGSFNELTFLNGLVLDPAQQMELIEKYGGLEALGGDHTAPHIAAAWAHACNTPFRWGKQDAQPPGGHTGPDGDRVALAPKPDDVMRRQFTHVIDVGPTILEAAGIPEPEKVDGIVQEPMDGTSFLYTLDEPEAPERHTTQYFEMFAQPRDVQGRLVGRLETRPTPLGSLARDAGQVRPRRGLGRRPRRRLGALLPSRRLLAGQGHRGGAPGQGPGAPGAVVAGGGAQPRAAADGRVLGPLRHPAADAHADPLHLRGRRAERELGHDPEDLRPLVLDRGRSHGAGVGCRRGHRRHGGLHRRIRPVGRRRRHPAPHLLDARRRQLQAGGHVEATYGRRPREDAVRVHGEQAGQRGSRDAVRQRRRGRRAATCRRRSR